MLILKIKKNEKKAEAERERLILEEEKRKNSVCLFTDGFSRQEFETIVQQTCHRIRRISKVIVDGPIVKGTVRTQSGISEWSFIIDFNNYGHITGKYWLSSENSDSMIPKIVADNICMILVNRDHYSDSFSTENTKKSNSHPNNYCPNCGAKLERTNANFCSNCGEKIQKMSNPSYSSNEERINSRNYQGSIFPGEEKSSNQHMLPTVPAKIDCVQCGAKLSISTYRKFICCPYCGHRQAFNGFQYRKIDLTSSKYEHVKFWMDCPSCRSKNMYIGSSGFRWRCPDCGYSLTRC